MYLLDTNVLSEARRGSPQAVKWLRSVEPDRLHLSVITLGTGRTTVLQGIVHLVICAAFLFFAIVP